MVCKRIRNNNYCCTLVQLCLLRNFKLGTLLHKARLEKGMTQEELARKVGTTKSYISKIENNIKEVRLSTLQKIVELGLGGHIDLSIRL